MARTLLLLIAGCGGTEAAWSPEAAGSTTAEPPQVEGTPPPALPASAAPDPATPEDLARAEELLSAAVVTESTPRFSPDGRQLAFLASYDGSRALYLRDLRSKQPARKVSGISFRFRRPRFSPDGRHLYFTSDQQGNEAYRLKRVVLETGAVEEIAAVESVQHNGPWAGRGGDRVVFSTRPMGGTSVAIHEQAAAPGATPEQRYENDAAQVYDVRRDGGEAILARLPLDDVLFAADLGSGAERRLYPPAAADPAAEPGRRVVVFAAVYSPDGASIHLATDDGGERTHLVTLDARSGRELRRFTDPAEPGGFVHGLVAAGGTLAFVLDRGTHHEIRILDARTLRPRPPPSLPIGSEVVGGLHPNVTPSLSLSPDGRRLALEWSTPSSPPRIQLVDTRTGAVTPLGDAAGASGGGLAAEVIRIRSFDGLELPTLIYGADPSVQRPVVMHIHGGFPFAATARFDPTLAALLADGYVVVEPNVRGSGGFGAAYERADDGEGKLLAVRDFRAVAEHIAAQPWADPTRMAVMGPSAGGYYTLMVLCHHPDLFRAGVAIVPVYDVEANIRSSEGALRAFMQHELAPLENRELLARLSPSTSIDQLRAPLFVYAAANDVRTTLPQIESLVRDARGRGNRVELMLATNQGHSRDDPRVQAEMRVRILRFLRETMPPAP
jgi:dipeptidyl aminopeptidase/acylaminoacyl peptidase